MDIAVHINPCLHEIQKTSHEGAVSSTDNELDRRVERVHFRLQLLDFAVASFDGLGLS